MAEDIVQPTPPPTLPPEISGYYIPSSAMLTTAAAVELATRSDAATNLEPAINEINRQLDELRATTVQQGEEIARLHAAIRCLPCPDGVHDDYVKEEDAVCSIAECINRRLCDCEVGFVLSGTPKPNGSEPPA